ncbi:MAG: hypothetical protein AB8H80_20425 [Planctomycetota bacterium]
MSDAESSELPLTPREPEIEFLAKFARLGLRILRVVLWLAGVAAIAYGALRLALPEADLGLGLRISDATGELLIAPEFVWFCAGLLLVLPVRWTLGRGAWLIYGISTLLWFVPIALPGEQEYGFILRMFASLAATLSLLVWRTLWRLGEASGPRGE